MSDFTYQDVMSAENASFGADAVGNIYNDPAIAQQASVDWSGLIYKGLSKAVDKQFQTPYNPQTALPNSSNGRTAGTTGTAPATNALAGHLPLLIGAAVLVVLVVFLVKK